MTIPVDLPHWLSSHVEEVAAWPALPTARECWVRDCSRSSHLHGLCKVHHLRARRAWHPRPSEERYQRKSPAVASAHDSVTVSPQPSESTRQGGPGESTREPHEVQGDATERAS